MPSQYKGNPLSAQPPSPAPTLGNDTDGDPIGNLPADGDTLNASAFLQAYKLALDWIAFLRRKLAPYKGIRSWDAGTQYVEGDLVWNESDGFIYKAVQSSTNENPHSNETFWARTALTYQETLDLAGSQNWGNVVSLSTDGISVSGGTLVSASVFAVKSGTSTYVRRVSFQVTMGSDGEATINFSQDKAFTDIRIVHATSAPGSTGAPGTMVWGYRHASIANRIIVGIVGLSVQGGAINVTAEGY